MKKILLEIFRTDDGYVELHSKYSSLEAPLVLVKLEIAKKRLIEKLIECEIVDMSK